MDDEMTEPPFFNPATRLYELLRAAQQSVPETEQHVQAVVVWAKVLGCNAEDEDLFISRFTQVRSLKKDVVHAIESIADIDHALYLSWRSPIDSLLTLGTLYRPWSQIRTIISDTSMQALQFAAAELSRHHLERLLPADQVERLRDEIASLLDEVTQSEFPSKLRDQVVKHLREILEALSAYGLRGLEVLEVSFESAAGSVILRREDYLDYQDHEVLKRYWHILLRLSELISFAEHLYQLPDFLSRLLPAP
jgi:hypothetical protein